jgi:fatty-acid desaturase
MLNKDMFVVTPKWQTVINALSFAFAVHAMYLLLNGESLIWLVLSFVVYSIFNIAVTAGFHQLFTHRSYTCSKFWERIFAVCGTLAFQGSLVSWVHLHYVHHITADTKDDPHNRSLWFFIIKAYKHVDMKPTKAVVKLMRDPLHSFLHYYGGGVCILLSIALCLVDYNLFVFGYALPVVYFYIGVACHQIFTHVGDEPRNVPLFMLLFPWADWNHAEHHKYSADLNKGGWCASYELIKLIKQ